MSKVKSGGKGATPAQTKKLTAKEKVAIKAGMAAGKKSKATPTPTAEAAKPEAREIVGWRPGDKFVPEEAVGIMKVADLVKAAAKDNPREWSNRALLALARSIERVGLRNFPTFNRRTGKIVGGHMRVEAIAKKLKWETCPVKFDDMSAEDEQIARLQDNNRAAMGRWTDGVQDQLKEIEARDREAFVQLALEDIIEQLANQDGELQEGEAKSKDGADDQGDGEGYVNLTFRVPAAFGMALKAKIQETVNMRGLVGKTSKGQALEILVANGDAAHRCITEADVKAAVDKAVDDLRTVRGAAATDAPAEPRREPFTDGS